MGQVRRCTRCADVIGVYEPLVVVDSTGVRCTSLAAAAQQPDLGDATYHKACYIATQADNGRAWAHTESPPIDPS